MKSYTQFVICLGLVLFFGLFSMVLYTVDFLGPWKVRQFFFVLTFFFTGLSAGGVFQTLVNWEPPENRHV